MDRAADDMGMGLIFVIIMIVVVGPLAVVYGADSRDTSKRSRVLHPCTRRHQKVDYRLLVEADIDPSLGPGQCR